MLARGIYPRCPLVASFERETEGREEAAPPKQGKVPSHYLFTLLYSFTFPSLFSTLSSPFLTNNRQQSVVPHDVARVPADGCFSNLPKIALPHLQLLCVMVRASHTRRPFPLPSLGPCCDTNTTTRSLYHSRIGYNPLSNPYPARPSFNCSHDHPTPINIPNHLLLPFHNLSCREQCVRSFIFRLGSVETKLVPSSGMFGSFDT